jgi:hypothetical protein
MTRSKILQIHLVDAVEDQNLRDVSNGVDKIAKLRRRFPSLEPGEAVQFVNRARDRTRLIVSIDGHTYGVLLLPTDPKDQTSIWLKTAQALRALNASLKVIAVNRTLLQEAEDRSAARSTAIQSLNGKEASRAKR